MDISIYNGKWIVPAKSGLRWLHESLNITNQINLIYHRPITLSLPNLSPNTKLVLTEWGLSSLLSEVELTHMIVREPLSQFHSALFTDLCAHQPVEVREIGLTIENDWITKKLHAYSLNGTGHWSPFLYRTLWETKWKYPSIKIVPLSELTSFLKTETGFDGAEWRRDKYDFSDISTITRKELIDWISKTHPELWKRISVRAELDWRFYDKLMKL